VLEDPGAFRGLILVDSFLSAIPAGFTEPIAQALAKDPAQALAAMYGPMTSGADQTQRLVAEAMKVPVPALQAYLRAMAADSLGARQSQLRLPVLQVAAGPREANPAKEAATLARHGFKGLPAFRMIYFPAAKHWIMWDAPEPFLLALRAFEAGLGR
jgi:pimeloyl-ACP methyl ester carboxylesterase